MQQHRWSSTGARYLLRIIVLIPVGALVLAVLVDEGPSRKARLSIFPAAMMALDPFTWTCVRNSLIFAIVNTMAALVIGVGLGWTLARRRFWGRALLRGGVGAMLAAAPAFLALGLVGIFGPPGAWPWPFTHGAVGSDEVSLESWHGISAWVLWAWTCVPAGTALVARATAGSVERFEPSWEDAARLTGVHPFRVWKNLYWPLARPPVATAAARVFALTLVEPGAPLILGLRRTIAFQLVESASRSDPFPRVAIWAAIAGLIVLLGWTLIGYWGGSSILPSHVDDRGAPDPGFALRRATLKRSIASTLLLSISLIAGWTPIVGLVRLALDGYRETSAVAGGFFQGLPALVSRLAEPPVPELAVNSLRLGLAVAICVVATAWLVGQNACSSFTPEGARPWGQPLVQGVGVLALPWLAGLAARSIGVNPPWPHLAVALERFSSETSSDRSPFILLPVAVGLSWLVFVFDPRRKVSGPVAAGLPGGFDAARLAGLSHARSRALCRPWRRGRWLGLFIVVTVLAATNLSPALLFTPWSDGRTMSTGVLVLAESPGDSRAQAAALALFATALNLAALGVARFALAQPRAPS